MVSQRKKYSDFSEDEKIRARARSYANSYQRRGYLIPLETCDYCDNPPQKHHPDYSQPLCVKWLCDECHRAHHVMVRRVAAMNLGLLCRRILRELAAQINRGET